MTLDLHRHPCFNEEARHRFARIHLPVAPDCNVQCNFCRREYDCPNESRPGVTSQVLTPPQALTYLESVVERDPRISVVGIAGPGDPFATPELTMETLRLVRKRFPEMLLCVASNGLAVAPYAAELAELQVSHVTLTINAVDPVVGAQIYSWVRDRKRMSRGLEGAEILWQRQQESLHALKRAGLTVKINLIFIPGVNDEHAIEVARRMAEMGADLVNCVPLHPVEGTPFGDIPAPDPSTVEAVREQLGEHLPLMRHCTRCRADAVGLLGEPMRPEILQCLRDAAKPKSAVPAKPHVAVASLEGMLVNQHLGEADRLLVFRQAANGYELVETRQAPPPGGGSQRWLDLATTLHDCRAVLTSGAGQSPVTTLREQGIEVVLMEGLIEEGLEAVFRGIAIRSPLRREHRCGAGCSGNGQGCM